MKDENFNRIFYHYLSVLMIANISYATIHVFTYTYNIYLLNIIGIFIKSSLFFYPSYYAMCASGICQLDVLSLIVISPLLGFLIPFIWTLIPLPRFHLSNRFGFFSNGIFRFQLVVVFVAVIINPFLQMNIFGVLGNVSRFDETNLLIQNIIILNISEISMIIFMISHKMNSTK